MKAIIQTISPGQSRQKREPEILFVLDGEDHKTYFKRESFSAAEITTGPNEGKIMRDVQKARYARVCGDETFQAKSLEKLLGREVVLMLGEYTDPDTQETSVEVTSMLFAGMAGEDVEDWASKLDA